MKKIKAIFYAFVFGLIWSIVFSIAVMLAIASVLETPIYTLLVTAFFIPFNLSDLRGAFTERRWLAFALLILMLLSISAFIFGLIRFASGYGTFEPYLGWIILLLVPFLFIGITTYELCSILIPDNAVFLAIQQRFDDIARGSRILRF